MNTDTGHELSALLDYLKHARGFDFTGYKRASLMRRIRRRMSAVGIDTFPAYRDYLEQHPDEFALLFNTILINVTSFFRDLPAWEYLGNEIIPRILERKSKDEPVRVWTAGCSSGQEAYTLAMCLSEGMGEAAFHERVKIYATDMDEEALGEARQGTYLARDVQSIPPELLERYFEPTNGRYTFRKDLRRSIIFGRHDLVQDAPISRVDLLLCRNTLMYMTAQTQAQILANFHFALNDEGFLFLGKSEMLLSHSTLFTPVDLKQRIFMKARRSSALDRLNLVARSAAVEANGAVANQNLLREAAFDACPDAQIVVDQNGCLAMANQAARDLFGLDVRDLGRPLQDLEVSYRPVELRSRLETAYAEGRTIEAHNVEWLAGGEKHVVDVKVSPMFSSGGRAIGASVVFLDITPLIRLQQELNSSRQELETAYEELQSTVEELETTNEELQSTNEELETTNEELQSTNEELETMNEELQSINEELRARTGELNSVNGFLESILTSLRVGVVVLDQDMRVLIWNRRADDMWGLRADEVEHQHFLNLDIGLPVDQLKTPVRTCLSGQANYQDMLLPATNRRGRAIQCRVTCTPLSGQNGEVRGAILLMEEKEVQKPG